MIVAFTREAEADLERIGDFIAEDNPQRAITFVEEIDILHILHGARDYDAILFRER